jgi:hypothetical protein
MQLSQTGDEVSGQYDYAGAPCTIQGRIEAGRFVFRYREPGVEGEGWFEQKRYGKFSGQWRPLGAPGWACWEGVREFEGVWASTFGPLRLIQERDGVLGFYEAVGPSSLEGRLDGNRLTFRYREPSARGEGWFELGEDGHTFEGKWRPDGASEWAPWHGERILAMPGYRWLIVVEAHWQRSVSDRDFSFGSMLKEFFARLTHVGVRQRFFDNEQGLERWLREVMYLPEPTVVVIAAHATEEGLCAHGEPIDQRGLIDSLRYADNVLLLHFSSCLMMQEGGNSFVRELQQEVPFPISGYNTTVDWAASALIEFQYFDMVLGRGLAPEEAARQLTTLIGYAGDQVPRDCPYPAAGFRIYQPRG